MTRLVLIIGTICSALLLRVADDYYSTTLVWLYAMFCLAVDRMMLADAREIDELIATSRLAPMTIHHPGDLRIRLLGNALTRLR